MIVQRTKGEFEVKTDTEWVDKANCTKSPDWDYENYYDDIQQICTINSKSEVPKP